MRIAFLLALTLPLSGCLTWAGAYSLGMMGTFAVVDEHSRHNAHLYSNPTIAIDPSAPRWVPPMDENRKVNLQDCSKPIVDASANLSCR
jgi:hypothetical protein